MCCCGKEFVKCCLYFFDVIFFLTGIGLLITGIYMLMGILEGSYAIFLSNVPYLEVAYALIGVGFFIILISVIGCIAAAKDSGCLLLTFYFLIVLVICVEMSIIIIAFAGLGVEQENVNSFIQKSTLNQMSLYNSVEDLTEAWDTLQQEEKCCGFNKPNDWYQYAGSIFNVGQTPDSCCQFPQVGCGRTGNSFRFKEGCEDAMMDMINHGLEVIGSVCVGFVFLQVILIVYILILYYLLRFGVKQRCCAGGVYDTD